MILGLVGLWARRFLVDRVRYISAPSDHLMLLLLLLILGAFISIIPPTPDIVLTIEAPDETENEELQEPEKFDYSEEPSELIGAGSMGGMDMAMAQAPVPSASVSRCPVFTAVPTFRSPVRFSSCLM